MDTNIIGIIGAAIILICFLLNQFHKLNRDSFIYDFCNLIGSTILIYYAYLIWSVPFMVLNGVWAVVSLKDVIMPKKK